MKMIVNTADLMKLPIDEVKAYLKEHNLKVFFRDRCRPTLGPLGDVVELSTQERQDIYQGYQKACNKVDMMETKEELLNYLSNVK